MRIEKAAEADLSEIIQMIWQEFPYVERTPEQFRERMKAGKISVFKASEKNALLGFVEIEFLEAGIARINGLSVKPGQREKGVGKQLLGFALEKLGENKIARVLLLVKESNKRAKALYESHGFRFIGLYHRKLDNAVVEEMELDLSGEKPDYVS